jgi:nucleotidyltransferase substrate binding protein (TIGR01987 family)
MDPDVRWRQRLSNFQRAVEVLARVAAAVRERAPSETEQLALIQAFEVAHELAWNLLKDYLTYEGVAGIVASRSATREAFRLGIIEDGQRWMDMIADRNLSSHTYDEAQAAAITGRVLDAYLPLLARLRDELRARAAEPGP